MPIKLVKQYFTALVVNIRWSTNGNYCRLLFLLQIGGCWFSKKSVDRRDEINRYGKLGELVRMQFWRKSGHRKWVREGSHKHCTVLVFPLVFVFSALIVFKKGRNRPVERRKSNRNIIKFANSAARLMTTRTKRSAAHRPRAITLVRSAHFSSHSGETRQGGRGTK